MKDYIINGCKIGADYPPYIIAELSGNHNGSLERALETINEAKRCGANAIKLQTYSADTMTIDCNAPDFMIQGGLWNGFKLYDLYNWAQTPFEWHQALFDHAHQIGITMFSTAFDETAVDLLESLDTPAYKIASFELVDLPLIRYIANTRKPIIMSTGMASEHEIEEAVSTARLGGCKNLMLLHCISSYPAAIDQANLRQINELAHRFKVPTGLSDHTLGTTVSVAAVAVGACAIEKHFTMSRVEKGPDNEFSIEPDELKCLVRDTHDAWSSLGKVSYDRQQIEKGSMLFRRSVYFVHDLPAGSLITENDIRRIRPGKGLHPRHFEELIGKKIKVSVERGQATGWDLIED
jgi:pseudaminic acid synthase